MKEYVDYVEYAEAYACFAAGNIDGVISEETLEWLLGTKGT